MADLYSLFHEEAGPVATFARIEDAVSELNAVLQDEPAWITRLWIQPFTVLVADELRSEGQSPVS